MNSQESLSEKNSVVEKTTEVHAHVATTAVDTAAQLVAGGAAELDPVEADRIRKKIDWHILPLMCSACCALGLPTVRAPNANWAR